MTRADFRSRVIYRLGNRGDIDTATIDGWLNDALTELTTERIQVRSLEGPASTPILTQANQPNYSFPPEIFSIDYMEDQTSKRPVFRIPGGFFEWILAKNGSSTPAAPTRFVERGRQFYLHPIPDGVYSLVVYGYLYPTWGTDPTAVPSIEPEWNYGLELVAAEHGARALEMEERATAIAAEWTAWLARRDTNVKRTNRTNIPQRGASPAGASRRNIKTGV